MQTLVVQLIYCISVSYKTGLNEHVISVDLVVLVVQVLVVQVLAVQVLVLQAVIVKVLIS